MIIGAGPAPSRLAWSYADGTGLAAIRQLAAMLASLSQIPLSR
jgi:hypothetical protein